MQAAGHAETDEPPAIVPHRSGQRAAEMSSVATANNLDPRARRNTSLERQAHDHDHGVTAPNPCPAIRPGFTPRCNPSLGNSPNRAATPVKFRKNLVGTTIYVRSCRAGHIRLMRSCRPTDK